MLTRENYKIYELFTSVVIKLEQYAQNNNINLESENIDLFITTSCYNDVLYRYENMECFTSYARLYEYIEYNVYVDICNYNISISQDICDDGDISIRIYLNETYKRKIKL